MALIIFSAVLSSNLNHAHAANTLQLKLGQVLSIYSEKAYRKNSGEYFEAVGSVVIIAGQKTLYGQKASFNTKTGAVLIEGSVRFVSEDITIYGSRIDFNMQTNQLDVVNARIITPEFTVNASRLVRKSEQVFLADEAEFTTCRDCKESWTVYGKEIEVELNRYIRIKHALLKIKGVDVVYLPYLVLPIKNARESGILFPQFASNDVDGVQYEQPIYWAIAENKDATFTPSFLGERGYGLNLEYRHVFGESRWLNFSNKMIFDNIYRPFEKNTTEQSGRYFRHFYSFEKHYQVSNNSLFHFKVTGAKDLDVVRDFNDYTNKHLNTNDMGTDFFWDKRFDQVSVGLEANYRKNLLSSEATGFDRTYVQTVPKMYFNIMPQSIWQNEYSYLHRLSFGGMGDFSTFRQQKPNDTFTSFVAPIAGSSSTFYRNVSRLSTVPYARLNLLNIGPVAVDSKLSFDYQEYHFQDKSVPRFYKHASILTTTATFGIDRIFGLSYSEKYQIDEFRKNDLKKLQKKSIKKNAKEKKTNLIGKLDSFEKSLNKEVITVTRNSYRHSQQYNFIHHKIVSSSESGNDDFAQQITSENGWFDENDAIRADQDQVGSDETRTSIPLENTLEFQWNNSLIRKTPKTFSYLEDHKYLRDNFTYSKIGYLNISQGLVLESEAKTLERQLTRLLVNTGYKASTWSIDFKDYYFHQKGDHILSFSSQKRFETLSLLGSYSNNTFSEAKTIKAGIQMRPFDVIGLSYLREFDLRGNNDIYTIYQVDFMPNNNCWIVNLNFKDTLVDRRVSVNFEFNFGNENFKNYRTNFWSFSRI